MASLKCKKNLKLRKIMHYLYGALASTTKNEPKNAGKSEIKKSSVYKYCDLISSVAGILSR
jgi:hypothetical protein